MLTDGSRHHFFHFDAFVSLTIMQLSAHYLGDRDFGPWLTAGTMFASLFSGTLWSQVFLVKTVDG